MKYDAEAWAWAWAWGWWWATLVYLQLGSGSRIVVAPVYCAWPPSDCQPLQFEVFHRIVLSQPMLLPSGRHNFLFLANYFSVSYWISELSSVRLSLGWAWGSGFGMRGAKTKLTSITQCTQGGRASSKVTRRHPSRSSEPSPTHGANQLPPGQRPHPSTYLHANASLIRFGDFGNTRSILFGVLSATRQMLSSSAVVVSLLLSLLLLLLKLLLLLFLYSHPNQLSAAAAAAAAWC